jgi:hypothetical protein
MLVPMRWLLSLLTFVALAVSPLAAPAAAARMAASDSCAMTQMHHGAKPAPASTESCCVAAPADVPATVAVIQELRLRAVAPVGQLLPTLGGIGPAFDDPPPKS